MRKDKFWVWACSIIGVLFITFSVLLACAALKNSNSSDQILDSRFHGNKAIKNSGMQVTPDRFYPPVLRSLVVNPQSKSNYFDFVLDEGNKGFSRQEQLDPITRKLIQYFFLGITLPSEDFWVNLNPVQPDKIASPRLTATDIGKVLLEVDLNLKKDAARFTDPRTSLGQEYWARLKDNLTARGVKNLQGLPLSRLWIVPDEAVMEEVGQDRVNIVNARLKICLESEYLKGQAGGVIPVSAQDPQERLIEDCAISAMKEVIVPVIEHDVNYSARYAPIRQVYYSLILAEYFKQKYWGKKSVYDYYINQGRLTGLYSRMPWSKRDFFNSYVKSYQQGEYSFFQQEYDPYQLSTARRHYFSGGIRVDLGDGFRESFNKMAQTESSPVMDIADMVEDLSEGQWYVKAITDEVNPVELTDIQLTKATSLDEGEIVSSPLKKLAAYVEDRRKVGVINDQQARNTLERVNTWLTNPAYPKELVDKLKQMIEEENWPLITECFYRDITFGTAGKRGKQVDENGDVLPGTNVINDYTIAEYTLGLARYLVKTKQQERGVVLGGDTRIRSVLPYRGMISYTELEAKILRKLGVKIYRFMEPRAIAQAARAVTNYDAASMEYNSASHNLWTDNGVKASNEFTAQLFPDEREEILTEIENVTPEDIAALNLDEFDLEKDRRENPGKHILFGNAQDHLKDRTIVDDDTGFIEQNQSYVTRKDVVEDYSTEVHSLFTPVHGASIYTIPQTLDDGRVFKFNVYLYEDQAYQDAEGQFPTVEKPDPNFVNLETKVRTLDAAMREAERVEKEQGIIIDFVFGLDPDADRTSFAVRDRQGNWVVLRANDVWALFTWYMAKQSKESVKGKRVIKTWATTDLIYDIADDPEFDLEVWEPAVGFNKIAEVALKEIALPILAERHNVDLAKLREIKPLTLDGLRDVLGASSRREIMSEINAILKEVLLHGCEESNGISPGGHTLEKDAATATVIFHEIAAFVKYINDNKEEFAAKDEYLKAYFEEFGNRDLTVNEFLNRVYLEYGYYATVERAIEFFGLDGMAKKEKIVDYLTKLADQVNNEGAKVEVLGRPILQAIDGVTYTSTENVKFPTELGFKYELGGRDSIIGRPSGTEMYVRVYIRKKIESKELTWRNIEDKKAEADAHIEEMAKDFHRIAKTGAGVSSPMTAQAFAKETAELIGGQGLDAGNGISFLMDSVKAKGFIPALAKIRGIGVEQVLEKLKHIDKLKPILSKFRLSQIDLGKKEIAKDDRMVFWAKKSQRINGLEVKFQQEITTVSEREHQIIEQHHQIIREEMAARDRVHYPDSNPAEDLNYRGMVAPYYNRIFLPGDAREIEDFVDSQFTDKGKELKFALNIGIGGNEEFGHQNSAVYNQYIKKKNGITYVVLNNNLEFEKFRREHPEATGENTLMMYISRGGETEEPLKVFLFNYKEFPVSIVFANQGPLRATADGWKEKGGPILRLGLRTDVPGRYMRRITAMNFWALHLLDEIWRKIEDRITHSPEIREITRLMNLQRLQGSVKDFDKKMAELEEALKKKYGHRFAYQYMLVTDETDKALAFTKKGDSLAVQTGEFIHTVQILERRDQFALIVNDEEVLWPASEQPIQNWMEGVNKPGNKLIMNRYLFPDEKDAIQGILNQADSHIVLFVLRRDHHTYNDAQKKIQQMLDKGIPVITIEMGRPDIRNTAAFSTFVEDMVVGYSGIIGQNYGSNPEVKYVRKSSDARLVSVAAAKREGLGQPAIAVDEREDKALEPVEIKIDNPDVVAFTSLFDEMSKALGISFEQAVDCLREYLDGELVINAFAERLGLHKDTSLKGVKAAGVFPKIVEDFEEALAKQEAAKQAAVDKSSFINEEIVKHQAKRLGIKDIGFSLGPIDTITDKELIISLREFYKSIRGNDSLAKRVAEFIHLLVSARTRDGKARDNVMLLVNDQYEKEFADDWKGLWAKNTSDLTKSILGVDVLPRASHLLIEGRLSQADSHVGIIVLAEELGLLKDRKDDVLTEEMLEFSNRAHAGLNRNESLFGLALGNEDTVLQKQAGLSITVEEIDAQTNAMLSQLGEDISEHYRNILLKMNERSDLRKAIASAKKATKTSSPVSQQEQLNEFGGIDLRRIAFKVIFHK